MVELKSDEIIRDAKAAGRVVPAELERNVFVCGDMSSNEYRMRRHKYSVCYKYSVKGVLYHYSRMITGEPPTTLTLYYPEGHPEKAIAEFEKVADVKYSFLCLLPFIVFAIVYFVFFRG